ncbi:MAG: oligosaccharide flippase family protein [Lachnospiraceae bacterium]|nr:oligosaccharide flippase family protein [Lachnospiraceae bacterium]
MGLGLIMHIIAKIVFVLVGYGIHMYLGKTLSASIYGSIGVIMSIININYNFLSNGARQAASHLIASDEYNKKDLLKKSYKFQMIVAFLLSIINFFGADFIAKILRQPDLVKYIRITAIIIPFTALYFISVGIMNGYKLLVFEAITVTIYPLARLSLIPFIELVFNDSIMGVIMGFLTAAIIGSIVGNAFLIKKKKKGTDKDCCISNNEYIRQMIDFLSFFLCVTIILNLDMLFVNSMVEEANKVGYYTGATNLSKVTYYLLSAIYLVVLPLITSAYCNKEYEKCKEFINHLLVLILGLILPIVSIAAPLCGNLMVILYKEEYRGTALVAGILMVSQFLLGLFVVLNVMICSAKSKKYSVILGMAMVAIDALFCYVLIPRLSLEGAAIASFLTNTIGVLFSFIRLKKIFGSVWNKKLLKLLIANLAMFMISLIIGKIWICDNFLIVVLMCFVIYSLFVLFLIMTKCLPINLLMKYLMKKKR